MEEFIRNVTEQIRCVKVREGIARELSDHIEDQAAAYEAEGMSSDEAVRKAVREMGDPVQVGVELDRIHRPQTDFKMIGMAFVFSVAGFFVLYMVHGWAQDDRYFIRHCMILLLSFGVMAGMYFLDYSFVGRYAYGTGVLLTIAIWIARMVSASNGAVPVSFMLVYLYVPVYAGVLYRLRGRNYGAVAGGAGIQMVTMMLAYVLSGSLHTALNVYMMCTALFVTAVWKRWFAVDRETALVMVMGALVILPAVLFLLGSVFLRGGYGFRAQRLMAWLNPEQYAEGAGYIYRWIRQELSAANWIGVSDSGAFTQDNLIGGAVMLYPTEPFVLIQLVCTYGILAGLALVAAFAAVIIRAFCIVRSQKNQLGFMMSASCFMVLLVNCLEGALMNTGYYPVCSMQLPFVSYGTSTMTYAALIGLLLSIHRNEMLLTDEAIKRRAVWRLRIRWEKK